MACQVFNNRKIFFNIISTSFLLQGPTQAATAPVECSPDSRSLVMSSLPNPSLLITSSNASSWIFLSTSTCHLPWQDSCLLLYQNTYFQLSLSSKMFLYFNYTPWIDFCFSFWDEGSLCCPGWPQTCELKWRSTQLLQWRYRSTPPLRINPHQKSNNKHNRVQVICIHGLKSTDISNVSFFFFLTQLLILPKIPKPTRVFRVNKQKAPFCTQ